MDEYAETLEEADAQAAAEEPGDINVAKTEDAIPWYVARSSNITGENLLILAGILLAGFLAYRLQNIYRRRKRTRMWMSKVHAICENDHLDTREEDLLFQILQQAHLATPAASVTSADYFDDFVAPRITRRAGEQMTNQIRRKLFGAARPPAPA